jgi:hypothetical protein
MTVGNYMEGRHAFWNQGLFEQSATAKHRLGVVRELDDGRKFAYAKAGETLYPGKITQGPTPVANHNTQAIYATAAVGDKRIYVTLGASAAAADLYKDGWIIINDATYGSEIYKVRGHAAIGSAESGYINLYDSVRVAITTSSTYTLVKSIQDGVIAGKSTNTAAPAGVPLIDVTSAYYFWNQVTGTCSILTNGTLVIGNTCIIVDTGAVGPNAADVDCNVGSVVSVSATTLYSIINLAIPGY